MRFNYTSYALLVAGLATIQPVAAQKKQYTITEATNGISTTLAPLSVKQPSWQPGTHNFYAMAKSGGKDAWVKTDVATGATDTVRLADLNQYLFRRDSLKAFPAVTWVNKDLISIQDANRVYLIPPGKSDKEPIRRDLPVAAANVLVEKTRGHIAYTVDNNVGLIWSDGSKLQVTNDTNKGIVNGQSVHRNEFGIEGGLFFSPKGSFLAYYHMDQSMVADYPIADWVTVPAQADLIKYPMAGGTSHQVTVRVFNPVTKQTVELKTGEPKDQYLTAVTWSPDEQSIFIAVLNRDQNHLWLNQYDVKTGEKMRTLFEETDPKYVEPQHPLTFLPGSNDEFLWWSQRDGYMHLYLYNTSGKMVRQLTKGPWIVNDLLGFNAANHEVLITSSKESPLEKHGYAVNWKNGKLRRLDTESGTHNDIASEDGAYIFDVLTAAGVPKKSTIRSTDGKLTRLLIDAPNTLAAYDRPEIRDVTLKSADGVTPLYGKLILPTNFDASRKYPVIVYLYNGPHVQLVRNGFPESGNLWYEYMAQKGYIVWTMDGRGSGNRGAAFEQATFRQLGTAELEDQMKGVDYLKSLPYVDAARMGIHGWSFGGFMTTSFMLRQPGVFKVGVAGGPVMDWKMYEIMYTERYMDTPKDNPQGYEDANLLTKVKNLKGKLLLIHGTSDDVVVWQHSIRFLKNCVDQGVQLDYFVYPGHPHNVRGKDRVHLMQKITDYFDTYLK